MLELNHGKDYTVEETALFFNIDCDGVKDYLTDCTGLYKQEVYKKVTGKSCTEKEAEEFFAIPSGLDAWLAYCMDAAEQIVMGKYTDSGNMAGTIGEIGIAFTGADIV